jgi:outer membrane protein assembly factor BamB
MQIIRLMLLSSSLFMLNGCADFIYGKDNTRPITPLKDIKAEKQYQTAWSSNTGSGAGKLYLRLNPTEYQGVIYSADAYGLVVATKSKSGERLWSYKTKAPVTTGPGVSNGTVVVGTGDGRVFALSREAGRLLWSKEVSTEVLAMPAVTADKVIVKTADGKVTALRANNGESLWVYDHGASPLSLRSSGAPVVSGQRVFVGFSDGQLVALSLQDGQADWQQEVAEPLGANAVERMIDLGATPVVQGDVVYVAGYQGNIGAYRVSNGEMLWKMPLSTYNDLSLSDSAVYASDANGTVWAFAKSTGKVLWQQNALSGRQLTTPLLHDGLIMVGDREGYVHGLSPRDGQLRARITVDKGVPLYANPLANNPNLFIMTAKGQLAAFSPQVS